MRKYYHLHKGEFRKYIADHKEEFNSKMRDFLETDLNLNGEKKSSIRRQSRRILLKTHTNLCGYQIHHCFGYEDPNKFIYIPKELHLQIHQLLRDNEIPSDSNHWNEIRDLVNNCKEYTYIRV